MRHQPSQSRKARFRGAVSVPEDKERVISRVSSVVAFTAPLQGDAIAAAQGGTDSIFTVILAVLAGILGLSAAILYRCMHQREEDLRIRAENAEAELRALLMMTDEAVLVLAHDGTIRAANPASEELFDRSADDFIGESLTDVIAQPLALSELTKHGPVNFETTAKRGDKGFAQVEMLLSPVEMAGNNGYLALIHDARAVFPGDLSRPRNVARKPEFQTAIEKFTHDLNNQLTSVLGNLSLILMARPGDPATHERVLTAKKTAIRAQVLSQKLQSLANSEEDAGADEETETNCTIVPMPAITPPAAPAPAPQGPSRILILDDEEAICMLVASVLDASGFEVATATSVAEAVRACDEAKRSGSPFSLAICDLSLPGDSDGIEALRKLRAIDPNIKAIVSSGYDSDPVMRDCRAHGFDASVAKPYEVSKLVRAVGEVLAREKTAALKTA